MEKVGRKTDLTKELFRKFKELIYDGKNYKEIAELCEIPVTTIYDWTSNNYLNLADKIERWKIEKKLDKADKNIDDILDLGVGDKDSLKVVADMSKFVKETLDKPNYSKRTENTGKDGKDLIPQPILLNVHSNNSNKEDNEVGQENQSSTGGNISIQDSINSPILDPSSTVRREEDAD